MLVQCLLPSGASWVGSARPDGEVLPRKVTGKQENAAQLSMILPCFLDEKEVGKSVDSYQNQVWWLKKGPWLFSKISWAMKKGPWLFKVYWGWNPALFCGDNFINLRIPFLNNEHIDMRSMNFGDQWSPKILGTWNGGNLTYIRAIPVVPHEAVPEVSKR